MLLALGPLVVDTTVRTVVVGVLDGSSAAQTPSLPGADAAWLTSPTAEAVASMLDATGLPVGVTVHDPSTLDGLVSAGAVAVECGSVAALDEAAHREVALWCSPDQVDRALAAGAPPERIVCDPGDARITTAGATAGATVAGRGPAAWGEVARAVHGGARVVRTGDVRSVRRVVTVLDRLAAARAAARPEVAP